MGGLVSTVLHGAGPHNTVFRDGCPVAIIDWDDGVGPGSRAVDFADAVWGFADVTSDSVPVGRAGAGGLRSCVTPIPA